MFFDFIQQVFYSIVFFFGIAGIGLFFLRLFGWKFGNDALTLALSYFTSLCSFAFFAVVLLFFTSDKLASLQAFSLLYGMVSLFFLALFIRKEWLFKSWKEFFFRKEKKQIWLFGGGGILMLVAFFLFFLQAYHTSVLDEWLHRPIVKAFTENGVFPLINPLDPASNFIQTYHYGTQIVASAFQMIARLGVSESLDLVKFCTFIGTSLLFYGMIFGWTQKKWLSLFGTVAVLFGGSSFFFIDSFTISHLHQMKGIEQIWPINAPLSYMLMGITGVGTPLALAFMVLMGAVFFRKRNFSIVTMFLFGLLFTGFFILNEFFAFIIIGCFGLLFLYGIFSSHLPLKQTLRSVTFGALFFIGVSYGVYETGGVMGGLVEKGARALNPANIVLSIKKIFLFPISESEKVVNATSSDVNALTVDLLSLRPLSQWGFPAERKTLVIWDYPIPYIRSMLLEAGILALLLVAFFRKKIHFSDQPVFWILMVSGLLVPFIFSSSIGDLNLAKTTALSFSLIHLAFFYLLGKIEISKPMIIIFGVFFFFGVFPGLLMGPNIQWQWISSKGKEQFCSQSPRCYEGELTELLKRFEREYPGLKLVSADSKEMKKVVDLTQAYVYPYGDKRSEYVIDSPELRENLLDIEIKSLSSLDVILENGDNRVLRVVR